MKLGKKQEIIFKFRPGSNIEKCKNTKDKDISLNKIK